MKLGLMKRTFSVHQHDDVRKAFRDFILYFYHSHFTMDTEDFFKGDNVDATIM